VTAKIKTLHPTKKKKEKEVTKKEKKGVGKREKKDWNRCGKKGLKFWGKTIVTEKRPFLSKGKGRGNRNSGETKGGGGGSKRKDDVGTVILLQQLGKFYQGTDGKNSPCSKTKNRGGSR